MAAQKPSATSAWIASNLLAEDIQIRSQLPQIRRGGWRQ